MNILDMADELISPRYWRMSFPCIPKGIYAEFLKAKSKKKFRHEHASEIRDYEEARDFLSGREDAATENFKSPEDRNAETNQ